MSVMVRVRMCVYPKANPDLPLIWAVGQKMWQRDFPGTYDNLKKEWNDGLRPIMDAVLGIFLLFEACGDILSLILIY